MCRISVIIITFNSGNFIKACLDSLFIQDYTDYEVIVVDNGSKDGTIQLIKSSYPEVSLIENKNNLGACRARNQGIEVSSGEWILTLDCDVILEKDFFLNMADFIDNLPWDVGIIQPKILRLDKKTIYSCGIHLSWIRRFYDIGKGKKDNGRFNKSKYIFGACCAAAFYNHKMLEEIKESTGYFDERFFFLVEDVDLAWRGQIKGWKSLYIPDLICCHQGNSSYTNKKNRQYLCFRNRYCMIRKNESFLGKIRLFIFSFWYEIVRYIHLFFMNRFVLNARIDDE